MHRFDDSKERGDWGERVFRRWWAIHHPEHTLETVRLSVDKQGIDGRASFSYQVKTDYQAHRTGNVFVETVSVSTTGAPGWALQCSAAVLFYMCPGLGVILTMRPRAIAAMVPKWEAQYRQVDVPNSGYVTRGVLVPFDEFAKVASHHHVSYALRAKYVEREDRRSA